MEHTKDNLSIGAELDRMRDYLSKSSRPVFFIGSGISRRYLGLPDWSGLLEGIAQEVGADFAEMSGKYDFERLAGELEYFYFRSQPWERVSGCPRRRLMREAIARRIETMSQTNACPVPGAAPGRELQELRHTVPRAVITTNYDTFAETMFPDSRVHIGRETSAGWEEDDRIDIYKIHGCVTAPDSIVITKEDYDEFFEKSRYLYLPFEYVRKEKTLNFSAFPDFIPVQTPKILPRFPGLQIQFLNHIPGLPQSAEALIP